MQKQDIAGLKQKLFTLLKNNAYKEGKVVLSSGKVSDYYLDARLVTLSSEGAYLSAAVIWGLIKNDARFNYGQGIRAIGGPTLGADPFLGAIAVLALEDNMPVNTFIVRKAAKEHGMLRRIEGPELRSGDNVIVVDDVATSGKSLVDAVSLLIGQGVSVKGAIAIIDREEGAENNLSQIGCPFISIFKASEFRGSN